MDYVLAQMDRGSRWLWLLDELDSAADSRKVYGVIPNRTAVVGGESPVSALVQHYSTALAGKTYICQGCSGSGKTTSALYLIHGDVNIRPRRAIMIRTSDSEDFATSFSRTLGAADASPVIHRLLARALIPKEERGAPAKVGLIGFFDIAFAKLRKMKCLSGTFETELLRICGEPLRVSVDSRPNAMDLPILIIDGLVKSNENRDFVGALYEAVLESKITALILVKEESWANELIALNGGTQVLPVDQVINNPREDVTKPFKATPQWKGMGWRLRDIKAFADMEGIRDVALCEGTTPQQVLDTHQKAAQSRTEILSGRDGL